MNGLVGRGRVALRTLVGSDETGGRKLTRLLLGSAAFAMLLLLVLLPEPWEVPTGPALFPEGYRAFGHTIRISLWWASAAELALLLGLLASVPIWLRPVRTMPPAPIAGRRTGRVWWAALLAVMALAGALRWPLAGGSLWWDEGWSIRRVVVGAYNLDPSDGSMGAWKSVDLRHALWSFRKPTNHVAYNVSAWASHHIWHAWVDPPEPHAFSERAFRAPALAAGVLGIGATALVGAAWGAPAAGLAAAAWLAVHPWHHRYGVNGRAYSFVLLFVPLAALFLTRFLQRPRTRDLVGYTFAIGLLLWSFPYAVLLVATLYVAGVAALSLGSAERSQRVAWSLRFSMAHLFTAMALLFAMAPNLTQLEGWSYHNPLVSGFALRELWTGLATGIPGSVQGRADLFPSLVGWWNRAPWMSITAFGIVPALAVVGLFRALRAQSSRPVALAWLAAALVTFGINALTTQHFFPRYGVFLLPLVALLVGLALTREGRPTTWAWTAGALLLFVLVTQPQRSILMHRPFAPMRAVAETVAAEVRAAGPGAVGIGLGIGGGMPAIYEPTLRYASSREDLMHACRESHDHGGPLFAFYGYGNLNRRRLGPAVAFLEDPSHFALIAEYDGIEPKFCYRVFRSIGDVCTPD